MKLPEVIERLLGIEARLGQIEQARQPNLNQGLLEALLRQQLAKRRPDLTQPSEWFDVRFRD